MTNETFKSKIVNLFRLIHIFITLTLLIIVLNNYITIVSDSEVRVIDINFPFYKTQLLQSTK